MEQSNQNTETYVRWNFITAALNARLASVPNASQLTNLLEGLFQSSTMQNFSELLGSLRVAVKNKDVEAAIDYSGEM